MGGNFRGLVPRALGQTEQGNRKRNPVLAGPEKNWDEPAFLAELDRRSGHVDARVARHVRDWARSIKADLWWGKGTQSGSVYVNPVGRARKVWPFAIWTCGEVEVQFQGLMRLTEFQAEDRRRELQQRLNRIPGVAMSDDALTKRPSFSLTLLDSDPAFTAFVDAMAWVSTTMGKPSY